jgi:methylmalonyl-CoA mutase C-terminal domain/subunit
MTMFKRVIDLLQEKKAEDIVVFGGGVIMPDDISKLEKIGVDKIFPPDTPTSKIVEYVKNMPSRKR